MTIPIIILLKYYSVQLYRFESMTLQLILKVGSCRSPEDNRPTLLTEPMEQSQESTGSDQMLRGSLSKQF